jgi:hypothetical protein
MSAIGTEGTTETAGGASACRGEAGPLRQVQDRGKTSGTVSDELDGRKWCLFLVVFAVAEGSAR